MQASILLGLAVTFFALFPAFAKGGTLVYEVGQGYEKACLNWNIAGPMQRPDVLSELKWEDLRIWNTRAALVYKEKNYILRCEGDYGKILDGKVIDEDFGEDHRKSTFSYSNCSADKGEVYDISLTAGCELCWKSDTELRLIPFCGWGYDAQNLFMKSPGSFRYNGNNNPFRPSDITFEGKIEGLNSTYNAYWQGPLLGLDIIYDLANFHFTGGFDYHWLHYNAKAHWNLRDDLKGPFHHNGFGEGFKCRLGGLWDLPCHWTLALVASYTHYRLRKGEDRTSVYTWAWDPHATQGSVMKVKTRLNEVNWHAFVLSVNLGFSF